MRQIEIGGRGRVGRGQFKRTKETRKRLSESLKGNQNAKGAIRSKETREKIGVAKLGNTNGKFRRNTKHTEETKQKLSMAHAGKKLSPEHRIKVIKTLDPQRGERSHFWKGGVEQDPKHRSERAAVHKQNRRARVNKNGGKFTLQEWRDLKKEYLYACPACKRVEPEIKLTVDHIIPIAKGGTSDISNIQPLCCSCNSRKYTNIISYKLCGGNR